ncbi:MAG: AMP-binding protein [Rhodospirillales bacterium]|nr:AMP-binding protein [Rhodospirillales bacterium]
MNIAHLLVRAAQIWPYNQAISLGTTPYATYQTFAQRAAVIAGNLLDQYGLFKGDRIAVIMKNCPEYLEALYGIWHAGLTAVPINAKLHTKEFEYILSHNGSKLCIVSPDLEEAVAPVAEKRVVVGSDEWQVLQDGEPIPIVDCAGSDVAWLFYTSGTTGKPKGAMLTHTNIEQMTLSYFIDVDSVTSDDAIIHSAPMSHGSGMYNFPHIAKGANQVIPQSGQFDPAEIFDLISHYPGTSFFAAPTMVKRLIDAPQAKEADVRNLKTIIYGGGPMYVSDLQQAMDTFGNKFAQIYGQGESPMTITALSKDMLGDKGHPRYEERLASVGVAQTVVQVKILDENNVSLPVGETGEVCVKGEVVMKGYWDNPQATIDTIRNGWLRTGDMGVMDDDGFITLKDRSKDVIISGGSNIYPREVEEVLLLHEGVAEVSVVGSQHEEWGEEVVAFIVTAEGRSVSEKQLDDYCLNNIARFKRPKHYLFIEALPKNNYGKVLKTELREKLNLLW